MIRKRVAIAVASAMALAFAFGVAVGQNAPTENKGVKVSAPTFIDLTNEIDSVAGRQLRLRVVTPVWRMTSPLTPNWMTSAASC